MKIMGKIMSGFLSISILALAVCIFAIVRINSMANSSNDIYSDYLPLYEETIQVSENSLNQISDVSEYVVTGESDYLDSFNSYVDENEELYQYLIDNSTTDDAQTMAEEAYELEQEYVSIVNDDLIPAIESGDTDEVNSIMSNELEDTSSALSEKMDEYIEFGSSNIEELLNESVESSDMTEHIVIISVIAFVLLSLILGIIISRMIARPVRFLEEQLVKAEEENDLTVLINIKANDEIGDMAKAFNIFITKIRESFVKVHESSHYVNDAVINVQKSMQNLNGDIEDISATTEELSAGMEENASAAEEVSATVEQIDAAVQSISDNAQNGAMTVVEINQRAHTLHNEFVHSQSDAQKIIDQVEAKLIEAIEESKEVERINELADGILNITSQTNLLSLNASIEAARAGEAGKGFAVVAGEIGKLAEESTKTVTQIQEINKFVLGAVNNLANNSKELLEFVSIKVKGDYEKMLSATDAYKNDADKVDEIVSELSATSEELLAAIANITTAINEIADTTTQGAQEITNIAKDAGDSVTESNKTTSETENVKKNVDNLINAVSVFKI